MSVVAQGPAPERAVAAIALDLEVNARNIPVVVRWDRSPETVPDEVESVPDGSAIGVREAPMTQAGRKNGR